MSDKKHVTIDFTIEMLDKLNPCAAGREAALAFLPAKISTDPEKNIALALKLAQAPRASDGRWEDALWLEAVVLKDYGTWPDCDYQRRGGIRIIRDEADDPLLIAQYLAMVADKLATDAGR